MQDLSLLNSVVGPVMRGPSSSHSAGPHHIANTIRQLATGPDERIVSVSIAFNPSGSFAAVYSNQGSDEGFAAGLLGLQVVDEGYRSALSRLESGRPFPLNICITPLVPNDHPNRAQIDVRVSQADGTTRTDRFRAVSTGGGMFVIDWLNNERIEVTGAGHTVLVEGEAGAVTAVVALHGRHWPTADRRSGHIWQFTLTVPPTAEALEAVALSAGVGRVRTAEAAQLCVVSTETLLTSAAALQEPHVDLADRAVDFESVRLGLPRDAVRAVFDDRLRLMLASVHQGLTSVPAKDTMKLLAPSAARVHDAHLPLSLGAGLLQHAMAAALAVMEHNTNRGIVVAAPTAGSAGIVPGVLYALSQAGVPMRTLRECLQVMALVGAAFAVRGSFAAELGGCSVETGASAAMAAGGICHAMGGTAQQTFRAASLCLMNTLGLVCDPAAGEIEIPCHARNIAGVSHAFSASIATMAGFDAVMPFDDMVNATVDVGKMMHQDLRCTGRAGCAAYCPAPKPS